MKKLNIVYISMNFPPKEIGGPWESLLFLVNELSSYSDITLILDTKSSEKQIRNLLSNNNPIKIIIRKGLKNSLLTFFRTLHAIKHADVVHFNCFSLFRFYDYYLAKFFNRPIVFGYKGVFTLEIGNSFLTKYQLFNPLFKRIYLFIGKSWDSIFVTTDYMKNMAINHDHFNSNIIRIIPNPIDLKLKENIKPFIYPPDHFNLLFIGRFDIVKGIDLLINSLVNTPNNLHLYLIGNGPEELKLKRLVNVLNLDKRIHFMGPKRDKEKFSYIKSCDLFVVPSRYEPFGIVLLEAMLFGKPILATNVGGIPEVCKNNKNAILVGPNVKSLNNGILNIYNNPSLLSKLGNQNLIDVSKFSLKNIAQSYYNNYLEIIHLKNKDKHF